MTQNTAHALIVDDEADILELLEITLGRMGIEVTTARTLTEAQRAFDKGQFDLCLTDMRLPDGEGIDLIHHINNNDFPCPTAVITAYGSTEIAVSSLKAGAFDFISKPVDVDRLRTLANQALKLSGMQRNSSTRSLSARSPRLIGSSKAMVGLRQTIVKLARSQAPTFISGESGTGKELVARMIHSEGARATGNFVPINCGAIPAELMESECFGYVRGAFTGAARDTPGLFARADGGTLFLDEVADLPMAMQVKLLRAIQERAIRPIGATQERPVDIRILSASHRNLAVEVAQGRFREDLYYRLNVIELHVPPLRERLEDLPVLTEKILSGLSRNLRLPIIPELSGEAIAALMEYDFPGNVRELENILERAVTLSESPVIQSQYLRLYSPVAAAANHPSPSSPAPSASSSATANPEDLLDLESHLEAVERRHIQRALEACQYNKTKAAERLGITFRALRYRLSKLGMD